MYIMEKQLEELRKKVRYMEGENGLESEASFERTIGDLGGHQEED